jgi:hypothetical protein
MLNPVATDFVLKMEIATRCGVLRRSDWRKTATGVGARRGGPRRMVIGC